MGGASPHVGFQPLAGGEEHRLVQREEDGEPAEHVRRVRRRVNAQPHVAVQLRDDKLSIVKLAQGLREAGCRWHLRQGSWADNSRLAV